MFFNKDMTAIKYVEPFMHWELHNTLSEECFNEVLAISNSVVPSSASLKRSEHKTRAFIQTGKIADWVTSKITIDTITKYTNVDLSNARARVEVCVDLPGFSLEPHIDVPEKLITLQTYISGEEHCGTNLYPKTVKFMPNTSWLITNTKDTLHGFDYRVFTKPRVSLVLNYVNDGWWDVEQLVSV